MHHFNDNVFLLMLVSPVAHINILAKENVSLDQDDHST